MHFNKGVRLVVLKDIQVKTVALSFMKQKVRDYDEKVEGTGSIPGTYVDGYLIPGTRHSKAEWQGLGIDSVCRTQCPPTICLLTMSMGITHPILKFFVAGFVSYVTA